MFSSGELQADMMVWQSDMSDLKHTRVSSLPLCTVVPRSFSHATVTHAGATRGGKHTKLRSYNTLHIVRRCRLNLYYTNIIKLKRLFVWLVERANLRHYWFEIKKSFRVG